MATNEKGKKKWSADVTHNSNALDLENGVFKSNDPENMLCFANLLFGLLF